MKKHKVSELDGRDLDAAVLMAEGGVYIQKAADLPHMLRELPSLVEAIPLWIAPSVDGETINGHKEPPRFSSDWSLAGPLIERERIDIAATDREEVDGPTTWDAWADGPGGFRATGPTPLIAAMRAYAASKGRR